VLRANWLDTLLHAHFNRTLWRQLEQQWPGEPGRAALQARTARSLARASPHASSRAGTARLSWPSPAPTPPFRAPQAELAAFRALRAEVLRRCAACDKEGAAPCLARARRAAGGGAAEVTPHLCWMLSQDTKAWSEHFFQRMALRFDARAAARASSGGAPPDGDAGVTTGNVRWWRCPKTRRVAPSCARLPIGGRANQELRYSAWHCMCSWREARRGAG